MREIILVPRDIRKNFSLLSHRNNRATFRRENRRVNQQRPLSFRELPSLCHESQDLSKYRYIYVGYMLQKRI